MDILLKGAQLIDGTGRDAFPGNLGIAQGRITDLFPPDLEPEAEEVIDVSGLCLTPGFIDIHSHSDLIFTLPPARQRELLQGRIRQGITTEIVGNCGLGRFPSTPASAPQAEAICGFLTPADVTSVGHSLDEYLRHLETQGVITNVGTLVAHGPIRLACAGFSPGPLEGDMLTPALRLIDQSLAQGAWGLSLGLIYPPGLYTSTEEITHMAAQVARASGIITFHQRSGSPELLEQAINEILTVGQQAHVHVHLSHEHAQGRDARAGVEKLLGFGEQARAEGIHYTQDVIPYTTVHTTLLAVYPPWSLAQGIPGWLDLAGDPVQRRRMQKEIETTIPQWPPWQQGNWATNIIRDVGYAAIRIAECDDAPEVIGLSLEELGADLGSTPFAAMTDLLLTCAGQVTMCLDGISGTVDDEGPLEMLITDPNRALISDAWDIGRGRPHAGAYGAFPRILGRFVRERRILDLPSAIRKMTSLPAEIMELKDRGVLKPGAWADIVAFDPHTVSDLSTEKTPRTFAQGIHLVLVNGTPLFRAGKLTDEIPGSVLRKDA
jgi:N-acyl-D-amino-acid deacylase